MVYIIPFRKELPLMTKVPFDINIEMQKLIIKAIKLNNLTIESNLLLNNGIEIPWVGLGVYHSLPGKDTRNAVIITKKLTEKDRKRLEKGKVFAIKVLL